MKSQILVINLIIFTLINTFGYSQIRYFHTSKVADSITYNGNIKYYRGTLFSKATCNSKYVNTRYKIIKYDILTGIAASTYKIDTQLLFPNNFDGSNNLNIIGSCIYFGGARGYPTSHNLNATYTRCDTFGRILGQKQYQFQYPSIFDRIAPTADNNLVLSGRLYTDTNSPYLITSGLICKVDTGGNLLWSYIYRGSYANIPYGILGTADSGVLASITTGHTPNLNYAKLIKLDKNGTVVWIKAPPFKQGLLSCTLIDYNEQKKEYVFFTEPNGDSALITKVDSAMHKIWEYKSREYYITQVIKTSYGYAGCGVTPYPDYGNGSVVKVDNNGREQWRGVYGPSSDKGIIYGRDQLFRSLDTLPGGDLIVGGSTRDSLDRQTAFLMRIDKDGCLRTDTCEATRNTTAVEEVRGEEISIYPSPATVAFTVAISSAEDVYRYPHLHFALYDLMGRLVLDTPITKQTSTITREGIADGVYVYQLLDGDRYLMNGKMVLR